MTSLTTTEEQKALGKETEAQENEVPRRSETRGECTHPRMVWPIGWPGNLVRCVTCDKWVAI